MDLEEATIFFGRDAKRFRVPERKRPEGEAAVDDVFIVGLDPRKSYHVEVDTEEMTEELADPGGIVYLQGLPAGAGVTVSLRQLP
jgi:hypothetical protein